MLRENPDGSIVRLSDVARIELGAQTYNVMGRLNGQPAALVAIYQLPGSNALDGAQGVKAALAELKARFPADLDYQVALDTTLSVSEGVKEISQTLWQALLLVVLVVFVFLQGWRATLIPLLAVPVSLIGTFMFFPAFGFFDQHAVAVRAGARHRPGGGRRHCRGRSGGAPHRRGAVAARRHPQGDAGGERTGDGHRPHSLGGLHSHGVYSGDHRTIVPAVCADHRDLGDDFGLQCPLAGARPCARCSLRPKSAQGGPARRILPLVQPPVWTGDARLCFGVPFSDSQELYRRCSCSPVSP